MDVFDFKDFTQYAHRCLKIVNKQKKLVSFTLNPFQKLLEEADKYCIKNRMPRRIDCVKCRQPGGSTYGAGKVFHEAVTKPFTSALVLTHRADSTANLFNMSKVFYENLPVEMTPMRSLNNAKILQLENPTKNVDEKRENPGLRSAIKVGTAGSTALGRGETFRCVHASESAYYPNAADIKSALRQCLPLTLDSYSINESTANGMSGIGEQFYIDIMKAMDSRSDSVFVFCGWWMPDEYEMIYRGDFKPNDSGDRYGDELEIVRFLQDSKPFQMGHMEFPRGFELDQIMRKLTFRRYKIDNDMGQSETIDSLGQWCQEYPLHPTEAFLSSGRPIFLVGPLRAQMLELDSNPPRREPITEKWPSQMRGGLTIYENPKQGLQYAVGVDVSEGLESGDASDIRVIDQNYTEVAHWHGKIDPDLLGVFAVKLAQHFNHAILAIEVNDKGLVTLNKAKELYDNLYLRDVRDQLGSVVSKKAGWHTNVKSKEIMIQGLQSRHRDGEIKIKDRQLLAEMLKVTRDEKGLAELNGRDRVAAMCIAIQAMRTVPIKQMIVVNQERNEMISSGKSQRLEMLNQMAQNKYNGAR